MSNNNDETKSIAELEDELVDAIRVIREGERKEAKIKAMIRALKPDFVDLDIVDVISKPLSELTSPINDNDEKPYKSEVEGDGKLQAQRQEEFKNQ